MKSWWKLALVFGLAALSMGAGIQVQRTEVQREPQPSTELLQEVRALRIALERFTVAVARSQLLLGRLQMQEGRLATLGSQAREVHARLREVQSNRQGTAAEIKSLTDSLPRIPTLEERRSLEVRIEGMSAT
jgi:hypothetical protein